MMVHTYGESHCERSCHGYHGENAEALKKAIRHDEVAKKVKKKLETKTDVNGDESGDKKTTVMFIQKQTSVKTFLPTH